MEKIQITLASSQEIDQIESKLNDFNLNHKPLLQEKAFVPFQYSLTLEGALIGGIIAYASLYKIGYIDTLWIDETYRGKGYGRLLLEGIEQDLKTYGCQVVHLETFDFQGPSFYEKCGYQRFGELTYPNANLIEYYYSKTLF
ncbi:GNAT family N-acetyltransferase [Marinilactibacillus sp. GCM10026970]|uniref:GNAT family N-acetyltransferase n=1 Tax=Marinilactibacillus sp. GCM10026970 TaxID=3252642 RepID=UPI0036149E08